ncbi:hypothetical protein BCR43DRAFT_497268 [Syncephalastrum racemosum]|uniref:Uncharacterized protein n=1 Tax=Syncephalastrum racemosum TaxID=13706 RepID=A0A1X2H5N0_SYNRA|nr:hypothetical protein BCR43DRAFT_497268 [Syncephalastrum racemosum]
MDRPAKANPSAHTRSSLNEFKSATLALDPRLWRASSTKSALDALYRYIDTLEKYDIVPIVVVCETGEDAPDEDSCNQADNQAASAFARFEQETDDDVERKEEETQEEQQPTSEASRAKTITKRLRDRRIGCVKTNTPNTKLRQLLDEGAASGLIAHNQSDLALFKNHTMLMDLEDDGSCRVQRRHASSAPPSDDDKRERPQAVVTTRLVRRARSLNCQVLSERTQASSEVYSAACTKPADGLLPATRLLKRRQAGSVADASAAAVDSLIDANKENLDPQLLDSSARPSARRPASKTTVRSLSWTVRKPAPLNESLKQNPKQYQSPSEGEKTLAEAERGEETASNSEKATEKRPASPASPASSTSPISPSPTSTASPASPASQRTPGTLIEKTPKKHDQRKTSQRPVHNENAIPEHKPSKSLKRNSVDLDGRDQMPRKRVERRLGLGDASNRHPAS